MRTAASKAEKLRYGYFDHMAEVVPPGASGKARIEHFEVDEDASAFTRMRAAVNTGRMEYVPVGRYARLYVGQTLMMSDTDMELRTGLDAVMDARGDVLVAGLGLGLTTLAMLRKPIVRSVTVVELSADVVGLVVPHLQRHPAFRPGTLSVVLGDAHAYEPAAPKRRFDYAFIDIWPNVCSDDLTEHVSMRKRWRGFLRRGGSIDSWQYEHLRDLKRSGR